jgi:hypothetical protein
MFDGHSPNGAKSARFSAFATVTVKDGASFSARAR